MLSKKMQEWAIGFEAKGIEKDKAEGAQQAEALLLQKLLTRRFGTIPASISAQISKASQEHIERWFDQAIDAQQLSDIFQQ